MGQKSLEHYHVSRRKNKNRHQRRVALCSQQPPPKKLRKKEANRQTSRPLFETSMFCGAVSPKSTNEWSVFEVTSSSRSMKKVPRLRDSAIRGGWAPRTREIHESLLAKGENIFLLQIKVLKRAVHTRASNLKIEKKNRETPDSLKAGEKSKSDENEKGFR